MNVYFVMSTNPSWMRTGYGASLLECDATNTLVSFVEFTKQDNEMTLDLGVIPPYKPTTEKLTGDKA